MHGHYPVGSGDAFLGGLLTELDRGASLVAALRTAIAAGAANALVPGPGRFAAEHGGPSCAGKFSSIS